MKLSDIRFPRFTFWRAVTTVFILIGFYALYVRYTQGLGAVSHLSDLFPWGIWIGFDLLCGVGLAAGGFTVCATVYIFHAERFRPIIRPTVLTAFLGYLLVILALLVDLGRPWRIWHAIVFWNPHSVMFEVAWCVMLYTTVLALEFSPVVFERFRLKMAMKVMHSITIPLVILGVILSTLHQSSLGSLFLIMPSKLHPLWYSPLLPVFFFISSIGVGLSMTIFESYLSNRAFKKKLEMDLLADLGKIAVVVLAVYFVAKLEDLQMRHAWAYLFQKTQEAALFWVELGMGVVLPMFLLMFRRIRNSNFWLFACSVMVILGFVMNRLNVTVTGLLRGSHANYFPSFLEIMVTVLLVCLGFIIFSRAVRWFPIFSEAPESEAPAVETAPLGEWEGSVESRPSYARSMQH